MKLPGMGHALRAVLAVSLATACSTGGGAGSERDAQTEAGPTCGVGGIYSVRFVNDGSAGGGGFGCADNQGGAFTSDEAGSTLSAAGFFFASCTITSATTSCPSHVTATCTMSEVAGGGPGPESGATLEIVTDANNDVTGTLVTMYKTGGPCTDAFTGKRDPNG